MQKSENLHYGIHDRPPFFILCGLVAQQILILLSYLILVSVIAKAANANIGEASELVSLTLIAMSIGTFLQVLSKGPIGSGYLAAVCPMPNYLAPSIAAVKLGGLGLMAGMVVFAGFAQIVIGFFIKKIRLFFPTLLTGIVFCLIAIDMVTVAMHVVVQNSFGEHAILGKRFFFSFLVTFAMIVTLNIWGKGLWRLLCSGTGLLVGAVIAFFLGLYFEEHVAAMKAASWFAAPPFHEVHFEFNSGLILFFLISAVASTLRAMGAITTAQQINDAEWKRPNQANIRKGLLADGMTAMIGGLLGTTGLGCTPTSVGLSKESGATSRVIAYFFSLTCFLLAFCPKLGAIFFALPDSVVTAGLCFISCILFIGGIRILELLRTR